MNAISKQSLLKITFIFYCGLPALSTPSYKLPITPVSHTNSPVRSAPLVLSSHSAQTKHHLGKTPASQSSFHNFSIDQLRYWNLQFLLSKQRTVVQTLLCITVKVQLTNILTGKLFYVVETFFQTSFIEALFVRDKGRGSLNHSP